MLSTDMIAVGDARLEATIAGAGDTVILLPAGSHHCSYLALFAQHLAAVGFRAVAVNFRGVGASIGPLDGLTLHHLAADIAGVMEALAAAQAHVVGHAFGNRIARWLATDRPEIVRRVVLLAAGGLVPTDPAALVELPGMPHGVRPAMARGNGVSCPCLRVAARRMARLSVSE